MKLSSFSSKPYKVKKKTWMQSHHVANSQRVRAPVSSDLKTKYARNSARVRIGDRVKLTKGEYSGIEGKVQKIFAKEGTVTVEGITREKIAGGTTPVHISTANLLITDLNLDDKWRRKIIEGTP